MRERKINGNHHYHSIFYPAGSSFLFHQPERKSFSWSFFCLCHFGIRAPPEYVPRSYERIKGGEFTALWIILWVFISLFSSPTIIYFSKSSDSFMYSVQSFSSYFVGDVGWSVLTSSQLDPEVPNLFLWKKQQRLFQKLKRTSKISLA